MKNFPIRKKDALEENIRLPDSLICSVRDQRAILFLGVGASLEGTDGSGRHTLTTAELRDALALHFLDKVFPQYSLMDIAERLIVDHGQTVVLDYVRKLLDPFQPGEGHRLIPNFRWRAIATTNYDLLIERAYALDKSRLQTPVLFFKDNDPVDERIRTTVNPVELLKLHGCIQNDSVPLILSNEHYEQHLANRARLFGRLKDYAHECPIIFCGYSLSDPHIRSLIYRLQPEERPMFYMVSPDTNDLDRRLYSSKKVEIIDARFSDFMKALDVAIPKHARAIRVSASVIERPIRQHYRTKATESPKLVNFLDKDAVYVHSGMKYAEQTAKDFYRGIDTGWGGIAQNYDVRRKVVDDLLYKVLEKSDKTQNKPDFYILKGPAGNGKTIALKRAAWEISSQLEQLLLWVDECAALDPEAIGELHSLTGKKIYLCIDRVSAHVSRIKKLFDYAIKNAVPLVIIGTESDGDWYSYCSALENLKPQEMRVRYLSPHEINSLLDKLKEHNSLGLLERKDRELQFKAFDESAERQLLVALHEATQGKRFEDIVFDEYDEIAPDEAKILYLDVCTLNQFSVPVRAGTVSRLSGISFDRYAEDVFGPLQNIVMDTKDPYTGDRQYKARHARVAHLVFRRACASSAQRTDQLIRLIQQLDIGFSVDRQALDRLTKGQALVRLLDVRDGRRLYEEAVTVAASEAFLLQQWAIFESNHSDGSLELAQKHIDAARSLEKGSKSIMHTQAEIARKRANEEKSPVLKEQYRRISRERLAEIGNNGGELVLSTKLKILIDEIDELYKDEKDNTGTVVEKVKECETLMTQARHLHPDEPEFFNIEARLRDILSQDDRFIIALEQAVSTGTQKDNVAVRLSKAYRDRDEKQRAYDLLDSALEKYPDSKIIHLTYAKMLIEDQSSEQQRIEGHLSRSYHKGDANHEARHLHAQYLFLIGERERAEDIFKLVNENAPEDFLPRMPRSHSLVSKQIPKFCGKINNKEETYLFITITNYPRGVFAHERNTEAADWDRLEMNAEVEFDLYFDRRGPVAANVRLRNIGAI